jgi:hypothetical protein
MNRTVRLWLGISIVAAACSSKSSNNSGGGNPQGGPGICADSCLKACGSDSDCNPGEGELCCDYGADGKACMEASKCPRFCASDAKCDTTKGEACLRTTLASQSSVCTEPDPAIKLCSADAQCDTDSVCCKIYKEPVCLKPKRCPKACSTGSECNSKAKEVCCTTLPTIDPTLGVPGLCVNPDEQPCPTACSASTECDTAKGEICCHGLCSKSCVKECSASSECNAQICCQTAAEKSPWVRGIEKPGYDVATEPMGTGGSLGTGGTVGSGGSVGTGGYVGTGGNVGTGGAGGGGGSGGSGGGVIACETCAQALAAKDYDLNHICGGVSRDRMSTLQTCTCVVACQSSCTSLCAGGASDATCDSCIGTACATEYQACSTDN